MLPICLSEVSIRSLMPGLLLIKWWLSMSDSSQWGHLTDREITFAIFLIF
jgi:hypothetical protein